MSQETQAWAKEQKTGNPVTKAILIEISNWAKPTGSTDFLSVERIAEVIEISPRTVQRHLDRLELPVEEGGLGLIERVERFRPDGGRGANGFLLVGYQAPKSTKPKTKKRKKTPPRHSVTPRCQSVTTPCQNDGDPGDTAVTRLGDKNPLLTPNGVSPAGNLNEGEVEEEDQAPDSPSIKPHRLPDDWRPPPMADLSDKTRSLVSQWPPGAYEAICEKFRLHWLAEERPVGRKTKWHDTLCKWLIGDHASVMRDKKAGVSFAQLAPATNASRRPAQRSQPVEAQGREDPRSAAIRKQLRLRLGAAIYDQWFVNCALVVSPRGELLVVAGSEFLSNWVKDRYETRLVELARQVIGAAFTTIKFEIEAPPPRKDDHE